jgi:hypothetical protein
MEIEEKGIKEKWGEWEIRQKQQEIEKHVYTRDILERKFLNVLTKVLEIYVYKNYQDMYKDIRDYAIFLVDKVPF